MNAHALIRPEVNISLMTKQSGFDDPTSASFGVAYSMII